MKIKSQYGRFLESQINKKNLRIVEIADSRGSGLLKNVIDCFGRNVLFVNTLRGIEGALKEHLGSCTIFMLSENYFDLRQNIRDTKDLTKLVKQLVNELVAGLTTEGLEIAIIYRANDLSPLVPGTDYHLLNEEFWRMLTTDLRSTGYTYMFVYEEVDHQPDILSYFADVVVKMSSPPQLWSIL